jgi:hypothetical protein
MNSSRGSLSEDGYITGNLLQLEKEIRGLSFSELHRLHQLEDENTQLKKLVADLSLIDKQMLQDLINNSYKSRTQKGVGKVSYRYLPSFPASRV